MSYLRNLIYRLLEENKLANYAKYSLSEDLIV